MDALSRLLEPLHVEVVSSRHVSVQGPYGARFAPSTVHYGLFMLLEGEMWVEREGGPSEPLQLRPGDLGLFGGSSLILRDSFQPRSRPVDILFAPAPFSAHIAVGGEGERTATLLGVRFALEAGAAAPLLSALSPVAPCRGQNSLLAALRPSFEQSFADFTSGRPGAHALLHQMTRLLMLEWMRGTLSQTEALAVGGRAGAFADPAIAAAPTLMHSQPGAPWTVDSLAERVSLGRTTFALRFAEHVGQSPFRYLTRCRIALATSLLQRTALPLREIAAQVGYADEVTFHRAFKRETGTRPGEMRGA